uniref:GON domain-containing protein n=1 Tax=Anopheles culicifacies TaxID=139723 RepID=A0A182M579_9DIPT
MTTKPPNTKVCESFEACEWKIVKSGKCNCAGRKQRTVKCFDRMLNTESNRCSESTRPNKTMPCQKPPRCWNVYRNCKDAQRYKHREDREYMMNLHGIKTSIYCHNMTTKSPVEYLTLPKGPKENYSYYIRLRAADANQCQNSSRDWEDESISYGATHYSKIRINVNTLQVYMNDYEFTKSSGTKQPFGTGGDCYSNTARCPKGEFSINLEDTAFRIRSRTAWETAGVKSVIQFLIPLKEPYQKVRARCGGYCGSCFVSRNTNLYLEPKPAHEMRNP